MGKQQVFGKNRGFLALFGRRICRAGFDQHWQRQAGQLRKGRPICAVKAQRHQGRAWLDQAQAKLRGDAVTKIGGADLWNRQTARCNHQLRCFDPTPITLNLVAVYARRLSARGRFDYIFNTARLPASDLAGCAFGEQHVDNVLGRPVAKQLTFVLFVKRHAVLLQQV